MKYTFTYTICQNSVKSDDYLTVYDFGSVKGYLFKENFRLYTIEGKSVSSPTYTELCTESFGPIPKNALSIETYPCVFTKIYTTPNFTISVESSSSSTSSLSIPTIQNSQNSQNSRKINENKHISNSPSSKARKNDPTIPRNQYRQNSLSINQKMNASQNSLTSLSSQSSTGGPSSPNSPSSPSSQWISLDKITRVQHEVFRH